MCKEYTVRRSEEANQGLGPNAITPRCQADLATMELDFKDFSLSTATGEQDTNLCCSVKGFVGVARSHALLPLEAFDLHESDWVRLQSALPAEALTSNGLSIGKGLDYLQHSTIICFVSE